MHKLIKPFMSNKATGHDDDTISNSEAIEMRCAMFPRSFFFSSAYQPRPLFDATGAGMETQTITKCKPGDDLHRAKRNGYLTLTKCNLVTASMKPSVVHLRPGREGGKCALPEHREASGVRGALHRHGFAFRFLVSSELAAILPA